MARQGPVLPAWYLAEQLGVTDDKQSSFLTQLLPALERISPDLTPRVLQHPLVHEITRGPAAFPKLLATYDGSLDEGEKALAIDAIAEILAHRDHHATHDVVVALEKILATTKSKRIASITARALAAAGAESFLAHQRNLLGSKSLDEVRIAARLLGYGRYRPAVPVLMELLRPDAAIIADSLIWALGEIGDPEAVPLIQLWLTRAELADDALSALGKIGARASVVRVIPFLLEGSRLQREKAAEALARIARKNDGSLGDPGLDDTVRKTLEKVIDADESRLARFHSMIAFSALGGHLEPPRILAALGGQLSKKDLEGVGRLLAPRVGGTPAAAKPAPKPTAGPGKPVSPGPKPKKGRRPV